MASTAAVPGLSQATRGLDVTRSGSNVSSNYCFAPKGDSLSQPWRLPGTTQRRNTISSTGTPLKVCAVLDQPAGKSSSGRSSSQPRDAARAALERLFAQAQRHEERRDDPTYATETELESALLQIEADLSTAVGALKTKEDDLRTAEEAMKKERKEIEQMRMSLVQREKELQVAGKGQVKVGEEIGRLTDLVDVLSQDLDVAQTQLKSQYCEVEQSKAALGIVEEELRNSQARLLEKDEEVLKAKALLLQTEAEWLRGLETEGRHKSRVNQEAELLSAYLADKVSKEENLEVQKAALERTEADLEARAVAWLGAQEEIVTLEDELSRSVEHHGDTKEELTRAKGLLAEVQTDLLQTQSALVTFKGETQKQWERVTKIDDAVESQRVVVRIREAELCQARGEVAAMKGAVEFSRERYEAMWIQLEERQKATEAVEGKLDASRMALMASVAEIGTLKKAIRQKDVALSDALLQIEINQAEMIGYRLELQSAKSELSRTKAQLKEKSRDLKVLRSQVVSLKAELTGVRSALREKEDEVRMLTGMVKQRDETIAVLELDLTASKTKLNEATTVVQSIAALSKTLATTASRGELVRGEADPVLMQTSMELFAANKALLARDAQLHALQEKAATGSAKRQSVEEELLKVKNALQQREVEVAVMATKLGDKDLELRNVLSQWDDRETDLAHFRDEVSTEANSLAKLDQLKQAMQETEAAANANASGSKLDPLELEVAQLEAETALVALRGLASLSKELLEECRANTSQKASAAGMGTLSLAGNRLTNAAIGMKRQAKGIKELEALKSELHDKDVVLEMAKNAMEGLSKLTEKLIGEGAL